MIQLEAAKSKIVGDIAQLASKLSPEEQQVFLDYAGEVVLSNAGDFDPVAQESLEQDWIDGKEPVTPEEFLDDPYYLGEWGKTLYPIWKRDLCIVLDPNRRIEEWALVGAQGTGKTTAATAGQMYKVYRISRMKNPQKYLGLDAISRIYFGFFSLNKDKAKDVLYTRLHSVMSQSPYFKDTFPSKRRRPQEQRGLAGVEEARDRDEITFPRNLCVVAGSATSHALSVDLVSVLLDEMNWRRKKTVRPEEDMNSALSLYEQVRTRIRGRFLLKHKTSPGLITAISSKRATTDFMDWLVDRMRKDPDRCFVSDYAIWEAKPDRNFSGRKFYILTGGSHGQSRILMDDELEGYDLNANNIVGVPEEFRPEFEINVNTGLRDIAGISTVPYELLFDSEAQVRRMENAKRRSPFTVDTIYPGVHDDRKIEDYFDHHAATRYDGVARKPRNFTRSPRYIHVDLSKSNDATGIAMVCPGDSRRIVIRNPDGKEVPTVVPTIWVDFVIQLRAPEGDQIDYDKIRQFIAYLRSLNYRIVNVSFDQYQSTDSMQMLSKQRFTVSYLSVDRTDTPYLALRNAIVQDRVDCYYYPPLLRELRQLVYDQEHSKIDHPDVDVDGGPGSKDCADALAGAFWAMAQALSSLKKTVKSPTVLNPNTFTGVKDAVPLGKAAMEFFSGLDDNPDRIATADWQDENKVYTVDTEKPKKQPTEQRKSRKPWA